MKKKSIESVSSDRKVIYPKPGTKHYGGGKQGPLDADTAKKLLGYREEPEADNWGSKYLFKLPDGTKVRCDNNNNEQYTNRPLDMQNVTSIQQEILYGRWEFNGEPCIIGKTGLILDGQHTLIAVVLASYAYNEDSEQYPIAEEPKISKLVVFGVEEIDKVINTINTGKRRTLDDVLYRSDYFSDLPQAERKKVSKVCSFAIRTLWHRMGLRDAYCPKLTHGAACAFLEDHPKVLESVKFITTEDSSTDADGSGIQPVVPLGYASALHYLMASSSSDPSVYVQDPDESSLNFSMESKASDYFILINASHESVKGVRDRLAKLESEEDFVLRDERLAVVIKGWNTFCEGKAVTLGEVKLDKSEGSVVMPDCGGVDLLEVEFEYLPQEEENAETEESEAV